MLPIPGGFHNDKEGMTDLVKYVSPGTDMEEFLEYLGFSKSERGRFGSYGHTRRNRKFVFQFACASVIELCDTIIMEDESIFDILNDITSRRCRTTVISSP